MTKWFFEPGRTAAELRPRHLLAPYVRGPPRAGGPRAQRQTALGCRSPGRSEMRNGMVHYSDRGCMRPSRADRIRPWPPYSYRVVT